jgi:hydrogenase nickel incorporation protein HypA/HybF
MHEFSLARDIWESVQRSASVHPDSRVTGITLEIGVLTLIEEEQLRFWLTAIAEQEGCPDLMVHITWVPAEIRCRSCQAQQQYARSSLQNEDLLLFFQSRCSSCDSEDIDVHGGKDLRVVSATIIPLHNK